MNGIKVRLTPHEEGKLSSFILTTFMTGKNTRGCSMLSISYNISMETAEHNGRQLNNPKRDYGMCTLHHGLHLIELHQPDRGKRDVRSEDMRQE